jgi:hypothetical protein
LVRIPLCCYPWINNNEPPAGGSSRLEANPVLFFRKLRFRPKVLRASTDSCRLFLLAADYQGNPNVVTFRHPLR